ncbi:hypothetical protein C8Q78DRAFT_1030330 [Trametes maxima]|nr:hypothetical protein C8Q78DRAFT_1030330 [Trametes maxima]
MLSLAIARGLLACADCVCNPSARDIHRATTPGKARRRYYGQAPSREHCTQHRLRGPFRRHCFTKQTYVTFPDSPPNTQLCSLVVGYLISASVTRAAAGTYDA